MSSSSSGPIGAAAPPPGETPDFANPRDIFHTLHTVYMILIQVVVVVFFAIRVYVKLSAHGRFRLEDWSCLLGWLFTVLLNGTVFFKLRHGEGYHIWEITETNFLELQKWLYISSLLYTPAAFFTKVAILLLVVRVFSVDLFVARTLHALLAFFLICYFPAQVAKTLVCIPVNAFWDPTIRSFKCINQTKLFIYDTTLGIVSDLTILLIPVILTWTLRVSLLKKVKIVGLLEAGGVAVGITVYRMYLVLQFEDTKDPTVDFVPLDWTVTGELAIGLICACFPSINYLLEQRSLLHRHVFVLLLEVDGREHAEQDVAAEHQRHEQGQAGRDAELDAEHSPETERSEPRREDYDVELAVLSRRPTHNFDAPGLSRGPEGGDEGWLGPLPTLKPLPDVGRECPSR
ncbi:integral membrane protein [Colletotrichum kahawae]|uniref:Integral membrane protein n=1 Tax=Colletotrichum kahawae TaxID=34407 RepID=A0AAD9YKJ0_COLKA|nr:integral membrane protein [Colletotrichum kahawae]